MSISVLPTPPIRGDADFEAKVNAWLAAERNLSVELNAQDWVTAGMIREVDLASTASGKGAALVGWKRTGSTYGTTVQAALDANAVLITDEGAVSGGSTDCLDAINRAITLSAGKTLVIPDGVFGISGTVNIPNGVDVECRGTLKALSGFTGSYMVTVGATSRYSNGRINGLRLDGNGQNIKGLYTQSAQTIYVTNTFVRGCLNTGIETGAGFEQFFDKFWILGASSGMTAAAPGLLAATGDSHFTDGVVTLYPIGVKAQGGNGAYTRIHPWGVYTVGSTPMLHGFLCTGEGNRFQDCAADSPDCANRASAPSLANGGYGFYVDSTATSSSFSNCKTIVAPHANSPVALLYFGYVSASYCTFDDCRTDDNSGGGMAGNLQYVSATRARETAVYGQFAPGGFWPGDANYFTFTPTLAFGGASTGITYFAGRQSGWMWRIGPMVNFNIHIRLTAKGTATGAATVGTLPVGMLDMGNVHSWPVAVRFANNHINAIATILGTANTTIQLYNASTGAALTDADFGINQEFWISGSYAVSTSP